MSKQISRYPILSKIMSVAGLRKQNTVADWPRARLMGMGGTFGRGEIRHCSTWSFDASTVKSETLGRATSRSARERSMEVFRGQTDGERNNFNDINGR